MSFLQQTQQQQSLAVAAAAAVAALLTSRLLRNLLYTASSATSSSKISRALTQSGLNEDPSLFALQAFTRLCAAFGPSGLNAPGTARGAMIASPSRPGDRWNKKDENDNYFFQWPRDSGISVRIVVRRWARALEGRQVGMPGVLTPSPNHLFFSFARMNHHLQTVESPSGTFETGGLGEPKFLVDGEPFTGSWGRPQNDGPALRSLALLSYASQVISQLPPDHPSRDFVFEVLYSLPSLRGQGSPESHRVINTDLDYICRVWREGGFDPWEEVNAGYPAESSKPESSIGGHFYVLMCQRQALLLGTRFARSIHDATSSKLWADTARKIEEALEAFWNPTGSLGLEGDGTDGPLSEDAWNDPPRTWAPWNERCLATLDRLVEVFSIVYELNAGLDTTTDGVLCGRYPEDIYNGKEQSVGHPWFICTHAVAEILALCTMHFTRFRTITPTTHSLPFFQRFDPSVRADCTYMKGAADGKFEAILKGLRTMARAYLDHARSYAGPEGRMDEQIERTSGVMRGARELTWSYASLLSAWDAITEESPDLK
ncbi:glycoside hydrolase family 15 protein [Tilletiaria anomala UBC 951]|uniref:glucan 1,4-alpha-glucosidase n=1 Tax=Tilletiaria anomala (strain ATCC 24038 / CBS 436.72 / UBC 951) TaxID=1037660 RepID=A0A066VK84_TILAU|nr:glycoside hydrolase family 15 protein [Tilletiaria anomala UBC 951]KDN39174.1 glycoside hydrolase family 15 protein [Tilletiaria anomala UBC 951]